MTSETNMVKDFLAAPLDVIRFGNIQHHKNVVVLPLLLIYPKRFITINEAQKRGDVTVKETGTVSSLNVENRGNDPVLIPFGVTVKGGKQDRTVSEPILVPSTKPVDISSDRIHRVVTTVPSKRSSTLKIPTRCVEASRWSGRGATFRAVAKVSPTVAFSAHTSGGQSAVWASISALKGSIGVSHSVAPTNSYNDILRAKKVDLDAFLPHFPIQEWQCGVAVFVNNELIGVEFYGNTDAWKDMHAQVLRAFIIESIHSKDAVFSVMPEAAYQDKIIEILPQLRTQLAERNGRGLGTVVDITTDDGTWRGVTLLHEDVFIQFYLARYSFRVTAPVVTQYFPSYPRPRRDKWKWDLKWRDIYEPPGYRGDPLYFKKTEPPTHFKTTTEPPNRLKTTEPPNHFKTTGDHPTHIKTKFKRTTNGSSAWRTTKKY